MGDLRTDRGQALPLVIGAPARQIGWVGPAGHRLHEVAANKFECPATRAAEPRVPNTATQ